MSVTAKNAETEHQIQTAVIQWWAMTCHFFGLSEKILFAIPNGGARHVLTGKKLKAEGVRSGVPDMMLAAPNDRYNGLFIELKKPKGRATKAQLEYIQLLREQGYYTAITYGFEDTINMISSYLRGIPPYVDSEEM